MSPPSHPDRRATDDPDERAALIAGAGVPQEWGEGFAALCAMQSPLGFLHVRWEGIIDAAGMFLDRWGAEAIRCGWSDLDVSGCHPDQPTARFDCMGLVMLLDRCTVAAIDPDGADLMTASGAHRGTTFQLAEVAVPPARGNRLADRPLRALPLPAPGAFSRKLHTRTFRQTSPAPMAFRGLQAGSAWLTITPSGGEIPDVSFCFFTNFHG